MKTQDRQYGYNLAPGGNVLRGKDNPMFGKTPWNKGVPRTPEEKAKMSASQKNNSEAISKRNSGSGNPMYGKRPSEDQRNELSNRFSGAGNPFYGKKHSETTRLLIKKHHMDDAKPVEMIDPSTNTIINTFPSLHDAARYIDQLRGMGKADKSFISKCAKGACRQAYGFAWSFSERCND